MTHKQQSIDLRALLHNLRDLDDISRNVGKEIDNKNKILVGGLQDCRACRKYIENRNKIAYASDQRSQPNQSLKGQEKKVPALERQGNKQNKTK